MIIIREMQKLLSLIVLLTVSSIMPVTLAQEISSPENSEASRFTLRITGVEEAEGEIRIAVFNSEDSYTKETVYAEILPVDSTGIDWTIPELPHGEYAIAVYHDKNTNGKLDTNVLGIPKEVYGFSNNARGRFGPASWEEAYFYVKGNTTYHTIHLQ